jgi:hypothetical protein
MKKIFLFIVAILACNFVFAGEPLTDKEIETLKSIAQLWQEGKIVSSWLNVYVLTPIALIVGAILSYGYFRSKVEDFFIKDLAKKVEVEEKSLKTTIQQLVKETELRNKAKILIVNEKGDNADVKDFLKNLGYEALLTPISLAQLNHVNKNECDLILFNFLYKALESEETKFASELSDCKGKTRALVVGNGRLNDKYKEELKHYLSLCNGFDTMDKNILQCLKQKL